MANEFNKKFIEKFFPNETVGENYPKVNYRLRLAGLTTFEPYFSEASKLSSETDSEYNARVNTSGKFYEEQEILLDNVVNSATNVSGLAINSEYKDGRIPETILYLEKCILSDDEKFYTVHPVNLNDKNFITNSSPAVVYPIGDIPEQTSDESKKKGWYVYRKTTAVQKQNGKLVEIRSGWNKVHEFSSEDIHASNIDENANVARRFIDSGISGFSGWTNEVFTDYKIVDSGAVENPDIDDYKTKPRTINYLADPNKAYTIERKVTRESNLTEDNPATWEVIETAATFPYKDSEVFSEIVTKDLDFEISGVYDIVEPSGIYAEAEQDFFEIDLIEDWGKSEKKDYTFKQDTKDLLFKSGESLRVTQKGVSFYSPPTPVSTVEQHDIMGTVEMAFSPSMTGVGGSVTGEENYKNFYELEYQLIPKDRPSKKLYYAKPQDGQSLSAGDPVFLNTGIKSNDEYDPIEIDVFGNSIEEVDSITPNIEDSVSAQREQFIGPSINSGLFYSLEAQEIASSEGSGIGYSSYMSGELYLTVPKGGYNSVESDEINSVYSAGEIRSTFYQGDQTYGDEEVNYALTEYRSFDPNINTDERYYYDKPRDIRISQESLCSGDAASELGDREAGKIKILDYDYESKNILRNAKLLNIEREDGSIKIDNLKSNKAEFERGVNLFFEKNYLGELTILATGQNQEEDTKLLKEIIRQAKSSDLGDSTKFYLERDIYIDSDVNTQANTNSPSVLSSKQGQSLSPFSITPSTRNPDAVGEEKLYMTQVYQKNEASNAYPFNDPSYFLINNKVNDQFYYNNNEKYEVTDIDLVNIESVFTYQPDNFKCDVLNNSVDDDYEAISSLVYRGVSITGNANPGTLVVAGSTAGVRSITLPANPDVYYEIQGRYSNGDWFDVCPALETQGAGNVTKSLNSAGFTTDTSLEVRALVWDKANITTNKTRVKAKNESPDSLILKSAASNSIYDWSKFEHKITNTSVTTDSDTISSTSVQAMVFNAGTDKLDLGHHRSFNILKGDFSLDFWVKLDDVSGEQKILKKEGVIEVKKTADSEIQFKIKNKIITSNALSNSWAHVAVSARFNRVSRYMDLSLFVNGEKESTISEIEFNELSNRNKNSLIIGEGLRGRLYGVRLYVGRSLFDANFTPSITLEKEEIKRAYKLLRFKSRRTVETSNWITNKNSFNNVAPPDDYKDGVSEEDTYHMSEWLAASSESDNMGVSSNRAMINYLRSYAYVAPNNPHINKNYEGTPITLTKDIDDINFENYTYVEQQEGSDKSASPAPYLYEDISGGDISLIRSNIKGGNDIQPSNSNLDAKAFSSGSRIRVTKYVYRIYTKNAVVVGDLGRSDSYGSQYGWDYKLQYSTDSGSNWTDIDATEVSFSERLFYNNEYTDSTANSFNNTQVVNSIPCVIIKSDITRKHELGSIEFRITKKQNVELSNDLTKVVKKLNFLPLDVSMPTSETLVNMTQQAANTVIDSAGDAVVTLDPTREYYLIKDANESIYKDSTNELKIDNLGTDDNGNVVSDESSLTSKPIALAGLSGVRVRKNGGFSNNINNIDTVLGPKPSGLLLTRKEDSHLGSQREAELFELEPDQTRTFITPSVTGSHFDELKDNSDKIINFSCSSATTGDAGTSAITNISNLSFSPVDNFYNSPIITSNLTATEDDKGKTFIVSGATVTNNVGASVLNIAAEETPIPVATIADTNDPVVVEGCSKVTIDGGEEDFTTNNVINLSTGDLSVTNGSVNNNAIIIEHDKITPTTNDANTTGVIDCSADLILPNGLSNSQHITFLNATNYETKVLAESSSHTINSKLTDYIPPKAARKFTYNANNWTASDIDVIKYNQLNLTNSDFNLVGKTIVHNEDVDVYITGSISSGRYVNIVRNQIENFDIEGSKEDWVVPVMRIFHNGILKYTAPGNSLGTRIKYNGTNFEFKDIKPIIFNQIAVSQEDSDKVFTYSGEEGMVEFKFAEGDYLENFEIFLTSKKDSEEDVFIGLESDNESVKFVDKFGDDVGFYFQTPLSKERVVSIKKKNDYVFTIEEVDQSDRYKFEQPASADQQVIINRSENFGLELPTINDNTYTKGFDLVLCNMATDKAKVSLPKEASSDGDRIDVAEVRQFRSSNYVYDSSDSTLTDYGNFKQTEKTQNHAQFLSDGDFVLLDGSVDGTFIESAISRSSYVKKEHKYSKKNMEKLFNAEGEFVDFLSFSGNQFTLKNHGLTTYQKIVLNSEKVIVAKYYYAGDPDAYGSGSSNPNSYVDGDTVLCFYQDVYYITYYKSDGYKLVKTNFDYPQSFTDVLSFDGTDSGSRRFVAGDLNGDANKLFAYIEETTSVQEYAGQDFTKKMYDFASNLSGLSSTLTTQFSLSINSDDDSSEARKQTYFVKVIDNNKIELYKNSDLSTQLTNDDTKLSDTFYVNSIDVSNLNIVNLGSAENVKTFSDGNDIFTSLASESSASIQQHYSNVYTSGAAVVSGVHYATGYNDDLSSNTSIVSSLSQKDTIFLSGKFHAKAALDDNSFNNDYYINAGLSEVVISNTDDSNAKYKINKNKVVKHTNDGTFQVQNQNTANRDLIYYPKHELHVLDRKFLSKDTTDFEYNFVFFKPDGHSDDLKIVLPDTWTNLSTLYNTNQGKIAVVNLHDRPVRVENFSNTTGFTLDSDKVAFISSNTDYSSGKTEFTLFNTNTANGYTFSINEDDKIAEVEKNNLTGEFYIMKPGDIIIDDSIHDQKKILVDGDINFLRPYSLSNIGAAYAVDQFAEGTKFYISNISKDPINVNINYEPAENYGIDNLTSDGKLHSSKFYTAELAKFTPEEDDYFSYIEIEQDTAEDTAFTYSSADLNSAKKYNIFGIQCPITVGFYYEDITEAESVKLNDYFQFGEQVDFTQESIYRVMGAGAVGLTKLHLINTSYDDISLTTKGYDSSGTESAVLSSYLQSFIDQKIRPSKGAYRSYTYSDGQFDTYYDQDLTPALLPRNKSLSFSISELLSPNLSAYEDTACSAFYLTNDDGEDELNIGDISDSDIEVYQSSLIEVEFNNVKLIKNKDKRASFVDASIDGEQKNRAIISVADGSNIILPKRKLITRDFSFVVINGSRSSIQISSPEGTNVFSTNSNISLASGKFIKISYASGVFTPSSVSDCTVLERGIYRKDLRAAVISKQTIGSSRLLVNQNIPKINIINNSGADLKLKLLGQSDEVTVDKDKYRVMSSTEITKMATLGNNHNLINIIRDGTVSLNKSLYEKQAVLFNDNAIRGFDVSDFFKADFIPFISIEKVERPSITSMSYKGFSVRKGNVIKSIPPIGPTALASGGTSFSAIDMNCRLYEFKLSEANDKIILPKKRFDYITQNSANISMSLYNTSEDNANLYKLDSNGEYVFADEEYTSTALIARNLYNITQANANLTTSKKKSYVDLIEEVYVLSEESYIEKHSRRFYSDSFYQNKTVVFKQGFKIEGDVQTGCTLVNVSDEECIHEEYELGISKNEYAYEEFDNIHALTQPKYSITPNASKVFILTHNADVEVSSVANLKIANVSNREINVTDGENNYTVYSCERADFTSATDITYSEIRKQRREDWFIRLTDLDIPHLIEDQSYFNEKEWEIEKALQKRGINIEYNGARYKFSNIFNTNKIKPEEGQSSYQTIEDYNDSYKFGVTFFSNQRGVKRDVFYKKDISTLAAPIYLKIPWDMKQDIIAYALNTGHEKITKCSHFNERTGEITLSGIKEGKYHMFESEEEFNYDFTYDIETPELNDQPNSKRFKNAKTYKQKQVSNNTTLTYDGVEYKPGEKIRGIKGKSEYKLRSPYNLTLNVSQFSFEDIDNSAENEKNLSEEKNNFEKEVGGKIADNNSGVKSPAWSKVTKNDHKSKFLNAVVEKVVANNSSYELIQGRKIKDIQGDYKDGQIHKGADGSVAKSYWKYNKNFIFSIPLLDGVNYSKTEVGDEEIEIDTLNKEARVKVKLVISEEETSGEDSGGNRSTIESPAYEYKILSSLNFTNQTSSALVQLSIEDKDSIPFSVDGTIRSLNEKFSSATSEEESVKAMDRAKARYERQTKEVRDQDERLLPMDEWIKANQIEVNRRNHKAHMSLKNNHGYSFVPFGVHSAEDPMLGFRYNIDRNKPSYKSIRFRLKKLTDKQIVFNDLTKDDKIGTYLTNNEDTADLQYRLESDIESIAYQDIARPGGVAKLKSFSDGSSGDWSNVTLDTLGGDDYIKLNDIDNGDAIVFKNSSGNIVAGRVYFLRLVAWGEDSDGPNGSNLYKILNIFDNDSTYDSVNVVTSGFSGNQYKIVNYFTLQAEGTEGHRAKNPIINKIYDQGIEDTQNTTLNFPIIVNNKRFYLERPSYHDYSDISSETGYGDSDENTSFTSWPDNIYDQDGNTFSVRANLELTAVAEGLISNEKNVSSNEDEVDTFAAAQLVDYEDAINWHSLDIFSSFKNILYRKNSSIDVVSYKDKVVRVILKLTKGKEYRYILSDGDFLPTSNSKIFINGIEVVINSNKIGYFTCTNEDVEIHYEYEYKENIPNNLFEFDPSENEFKLTEGKKGFIENLYKSIFITESAYYVDQSKKIDGDTLERVDYMDYQIPNLNNYSGDSENVLFTPSSFCYTEKLDRIFSFDKKYEFLRDSNTSHGLAYDGPLPATVKYIYPTTLNKEELSFYISPEYLKGFINGFESAKSDGSTSFRNRTKSITFDLEKLDGSGNFVQVAGKQNLKVSINNENNLLTSRIAQVSDSTSDVYRMVIKSEVFEYYDEGEPRTFKNDLIRVPFNWTSIIDQSKIKDLSSNGVFSLGLAENYLLGNAISIPKDGVTMFGCHSYTRLADNYDFEIPHERLYKYRISHKLKASYKDRIATGGISKVIVDSGGENYKVSPDITIAAPKSEGDAILKKTAKARAHVESGKIVHVEIVDSGAGYSVVGEVAAKQKIVNRRVDGIPFVFHSIVIQEAEFSHSFTLASGSKVVNYDGSRPVILGASISGSGITSGTKITKINSATQFEISNAATSTGASTLLVDHVEKQMPYIPLSEHKGVETAEVSITNNYPDSGLCQEEFGILLQESEALADYVGVDPQNASAIADLESTLTRYVNTINAVSESDDWNNVKDLERKIKEKEDNFNNRNIESKDTQSYATSTEDEYSELQGTESSQFLGLYQADEREEVEQTVSTILDDGGCQKEANIVPTEAALTAIINNNSIAEYRVVKNEIANKSQPWLSSFSRAQEPSLPKGFGINPGSPVTSEVFNSYAKTINNMRFLGAYVPVFAKVKKYRKYEYRYVEDMAEMTFSSDDNTIDAGEEKTGYVGFQEYMTHVNLSKQNFIDFYDHKAKAYRRAWFSGFKSDLTGSIENITDTGKSQIQEEKSDGYNPDDVGLPNIVNIPEENGIFCFPEERDDVSGDNSYARVLTRAEGLELPQLNKRRAFAFGGELVYTSEEYDITSETMDTDVSIVNIAGSEIIDASYENELVFGCQVKGKPFWSTFLKTTIEWTEFEIVPSPSFLESAVGEDGLGKLEDINGTIFVTRGICKNEKIGTVDTEEGYHSLCTDGDNRGGTQAEFSYEEYFGLSNGDDIVGPSMQEFEFYSKEKLDTSVGKQVFKMQPEFTQALAVYGSNETKLIVRESDGTSNPNFQSGPCVHKCSPFGRKVFIISDEQLRFDLMKDG